ncbi:MAG: glycosyltransferase family 2 protein [Mesorhizobium sp.]|nr:MAG: glycosyltransferase family 2 protein [Mesorhizobium sp.]TIL40498.1 MAG: glycosyltransferase family 2 protein [Mesorhizobium sp.]
MGLGFEDRNNTKQELIKGNPVQKIPITVIIPVKNEEGNLPRCLERLGRFERVIVVDSGSEDKTVAIAEKNGAEIVHFRWNGLYPKKRNWVLINHAITTPWVFFLDADEVVNDVFCDEVKARTASDEYVGFWLKYRNYFMGRELKFGVAQKKLALFRVDAGMYERIEEDRWSSLDMEVHEHPILAGRVGAIETLIDHRDFRGIDRFIGRHQAYAKWEANRYMLLRSGAAQNTLTERQSVKYKYLPSRWYAFAYFFYSYVLKGGVLDGWPGFSYAFYKTWYFHTISNLIREYEEEKKENVNIRNNSLSTQS